MTFPQNEERQKFWEAFRACAEENRVRPDRSSFYVKWAQAFVSLTHVLNEPGLSVKSPADL